jgi:hypothetical protein
MKNPFSSLAQSLRSLSYIFLFGCILYSTFVYFRQLDTNNIPELIDKSQFSSSFVRVKVASIDILPEIYENIATNKTILISYITSDKGISFVSPLPEDKIKENKFEQGSVLIFGKDDTSGSKIENKKWEIIKGVNKYPGMKSQDMLYLQGDKPDFWKTFEPAGVGMVAVFAIWIYTEKYFTNQKTKELQDKLITPTATSEKITVTEDMLTANPRVTKNSLEGKLINKTK